MIRSSFPPLHQPAKGYRYGIDSFLLARFAQFQKSETVCDLGTGVGILAILALTRGGVRQVTAIEIQEELAQLALKNVEKLGLLEKMQIIHANWKRAPHLLPQHSFDIVISNPPYRKLKTGRVPPESAQAIAKHEIHGSLQDLLATANLLMKKTGRFCVIYPPLRLEELIVELQNKKLKIQRMAFIHPFVNRPASHVMLEAVHSVAGEIQVEPPVIVYRDVDHYMPEVEEWVGEK